MNYTLDMLELSSRKGQEKKMAFLTTAAQNELESTNEGLAFPDAVISRRVGKRKGRERWIKRYS